MNTNKSPYKPGSLKKLREKAIESIKKSDLSDHLKKIAIARLCSK